MILTTYNLALISAIAERTRNPKKWNGAISSYLDYQLINFLACVPRSLVDRLPPEDRLFLDLIHKVMLPSARVKLCVEWDKIRRGETTVDEARTRIPRKDLAFAKFKAKYQASMKAANAAGKQDQKENRSPVLFLGLSFDFECAMCCLFLLLPLLFLVPMIP